MQVTSGFIRGLIDGSTISVKSHNLDQSTENQITLTINNGEDTISINLDDQELFELGFSLMSCATNPEIDGVVDLLEVNLNEDMTAAKKFKEVMKEVCEELSVF